MSDYFANLLGNASWRCWCIVARQCERLMNLNTRARNEAKQFHYSESRLHNHCRQTRRDTHTQRGPREVQSATRCACASVTNAQRTKITRKFSTRARCVGDSFCARRSHVHGVRNHWIEKLICRARRRRCCCTVDGNGEVHDFRGVRDDDDDA